MARTPAFVKKLVPEGSVRDSLYDRTVRRRIRYFLFRLQTDANKGAKAPGEEIPRGFKTHYQKQEWFDGWENFGITWDVGDTEAEADVADLDDNVDDSDWFDPLKVVPRWQSIYEEWDAVIAGELKTNEIAARKRKRASEVKAANGDED